MRRKQTAFAFIIPLIMSGGPAIAGDGWYVGLNIGPSFLEDATNSDTLVDIESASDTGYTLSGSLGRFWSNGFRAEAELAWRDYDLDSLTVTRIGNLTGLNIGSIAVDEGSVSSFSLMANGAYDFWNSTRFTPYLIGGLGPAYVSLNDVRALGVDIANDGAWVLAYQGGAGVAYALTDRFLVEAGYRYFATTDPRLEDSVGDPFDSEFASHSILFGGRYSF